MSSSQQRLLLWFCSPAEEPVPGGSDPDRGATQPTDSDGDAGPQSSSPRTSHISLTNGGYDGCFHSGGLKQFVVLFSEHGPEHGEPAAQEEHLGAPEDRPAGSAPEGRGDQEAEPEVRPGTVRDGKANILTHVQVV